MWLQLDVLLARNDLDLEIFNKMTAEEDNLQVNTVLRSDI